MNFLSFNNWQPYFSRAMNIPTSTCLLINLCIHEKKLNLRSNKLLTSYKYIYSL